MQEIDSINWSSHFNFILDQKKILKTLSEAERDLLLARSTGLNNYCKLLLRESKLNLLQLVSQ